MANPTPSQIKQALEGVAPGTKVTMKLADGSERVGTFSGTDSDAVTFEDADQVDLDQVEGVFIEGTSEGPE